jgi:hypothetical protein
MTEHKTTTPIRAGLRIAALSVLAAFATLDAHATALGDLAATMQPGQFKTLTTTNLNQGGLAGGIYVPSGGDGVVQEYSDEALRNPITKKIYIIGCGRTNSGSGQYVCGNSGAEDAKWIEYDENTNSWKTMPTTPFSLYPHTYDHAALDPATGDYYFRVHGSNEVWRYTGGNWVSLPDMPNWGSCCGAIEYFPELGGIVFPDPRTGGGQFYLYKPGASGWQTLPGGIAFGDYHYITEYSAKHKLLFIGGGVGAENVLLKMDATGKVTKAANAPVSLGIASCGAVHTVDPVSGNLVVFHCNGNIYSYNPTTNAWAQHGTHPLGTGYDLLTAATPVAEHGVIFLARAGAQGDSPGSTVYLYKHTTGSAPPPDTTPPNPPLSLRVQ